MTDQPPMVVYDIETYPNFFSLCAVDVWSDVSATFEISTRRNDRDALMQWLFALADANVEMVGFNNVRFDYPVIHKMMLNPTGCTHQDAYNKVQWIITDGRFEHTVWPSDRIIPQIDLFKIHHFDNKARSTSLKALQVNMRSESVEDLPIPPGTELSNEEMDRTLEYCMHDVTETKKFALKSMDQINFRRELSRKYNRDFMNHNDTKIGKDYFIMKLEESGVQCFYRGPNGRQPRQTIRADGIRLADAVFPYIRFERPEFNRVLNWLRDQTIYETKGVFNDLSATVDGFKFSFGLGGIHGSVKNRIIRSDDHHVLIDYDVASYYPNIAIANHLYPAHLSEQFCTIYEDMFKQRKTYPKGTAENAMMKLALNGVYGDSNNIHSPFYDPLYTMSTTTNGQLMLCMLAEQLMKIPGLEMVQVNTDGLTVYAPRAFEPLIEDVCRWWQEFTLLELERTDYSIMAILNVSSYIAVGTDGKIKRKKDYGYVTANEDPNTQEKPWYKDQSALVVPKAAEAAIVRGESIEDFINAHDDPFDFMLRAKAPRTSHLVLQDDNGVDHPLQKTTRYYIGNQGGSLFKVMPPTGPEGQFKKKNDVSDRAYHEWHAANGNVWNPDIHTGNKSVFAERRTGINVGWKVAECNRADRFDWGNLDRSYYIKEARKLVDCLREHDD